MVQFCSSYLHSVIIPLPVITFVSFIIMNSNYHVNLFIKHFTSNKVSMQPWSREDCTVSKNPSSPLSRLTGWGWQTLSGKHGTSVSKDMHVGADPVPTANHSFQNYTSWCHIVGWLVRLPCAADEQSRFAPDPWGFGLRNCPHCWRLHNCSKIIHFLCHPKKKQKQLHTHTYSIQTDGRVERQHIIEIGKDCFGGFLVTANAR